MQFKEEFEPEDVEFPNTSPKPQSKLLSFQEAIDEMLTGKKVTSVEWGNPNFYGHISDGYLQVFTEKGNSNWILREVDILAKDYRLI